MNLNLGLFGFIVSACSHLDRMETNEGLIAKDIEDINYILEWPPMYETYLFFIFNYYHKLAYKDLLLSSLFC